MKLTILFGTEMGTAERTAEAIAAALAPDHEAAVHDMCDYDLDDLDIGRPCIIVCSTYGSGDLPTGAEPFFAQLDDRLPDLTGLRFAVFGLGDTVYDDTFNRGGEICARRLSDLGATQFGEHARHDASTTIDPRDQAADWVRTLPIGALTPA